jgi:uncharacterized membrane protein YhaH (DUF805 family)
MRDNFCNSSDEGGENMNWLVSLFLFRGRIGRWRFRLHFALALLLLLVLLIVFWAYALSIPGAYENGGPTPLPQGVFGMAATVLYFTFVVAACAIALAAMAKRLHDRDKGWLWVVLYVLVPNAVSGFAEYLVAGGIAARGAIWLVLQIVALALSLWGLIEMGFLRGTAGPNRFGLDPLAKP